MLCIYTYSNRKLGGIFLSYLKSTLEQYSVEKIVNILLKKSEMTIPPSWSIAICYWGRDPLEGFYVNKTSIEARALTFY